MSKPKFEQNDKKTLTAEEIKKYKQEFGEIYKIQVEDKACFIHKPTRMILDAADAGSKKAQSRFNEILLKGCWLAGDKEIIDDDEYFLGASTQLDEVIRYKEASLKKL